jgi:hypothetical protein
LSGLHFEFFHMALSTLQKEFNRRRRMLYTSVEQPKESTLFFVYLFWVIRRTIRHSSPVLDC